MNKFNLLIIIVFGGLICHAQEDSTTQATGDALQEWHIVSESKQSSESCLPLIEELRDKARERGQTLNMPVAMMGSSVTASVTGNSEEYSSLVGSFLVYNGILEKTYQMQASEEGCQLQGVRVKFTRINKNAPQYDRTFDAKDCTLYSQRYEEELAKKEQLEAAGKIYLPPVDVDKFGNICHEVIGHFPETKVFDIK